MYLGTWGDFLGALGNLAAVCYAVCKVSHTPRPKVFFYVVRIREKEKVIWRLKVYNSDARKVYLQVLKREKRQTKPLGMMYIDPLETSAAYYDIQICEGSEFTCEQIQVKDEISKCNFYLNFTKDEEDKNLYLAVSIYRKICFAHRYISVYEKYKEIKENNNLENDKIKEDKQISVNTCMINKVKITLLGSEKDHFFEELILEEIRYASDGKNKVYRISSSNQKLPPEFKENAYIQIKNDDHIVLKKAFIDKRNDQFSMIVQTLS